ncbi:MAG: hypothetical protein M0R37_13475 [Bacteroidales bacterium]|nr:hypothetical protein [Bacteroidales bacterium]
MTYAALPPDLRALCLEVLTVKQMEVVELRCANLGKRRVARHLGISPSAVTDRTEAAMKRLEKACAQRGIELPALLYEMKEAA